MADRIRFAVSATPIETITDENNVSHDILASEVRHILRGNGDSQSLTNYSGVADVQGFKDAAVNYRSAGCGDGGTALTTLDDPDFIFIKNTGHIYSNATALGAVTTDCVIVALQISGFDTGSAGGWYTAAGAAQTYFAAIAFLKPGQGIVLPYTATNITQFGAVAGDCSGLHSSGAGDNGVIRLVVKTVNASGAAATTNNAVEFLAVT